MTPSPITSAWRRIRRRRRAPAAAEPASPRAGPVDERDRAIIERALPLTMTGVPRLQALIDAVRYCEASGIAGAFAECGVWRGGSVLAMVLALQQLGSADRDIYLYDTFEGMTPPSELDTSPIDPPALETWERAERARARPWGHLFDPATFSEEGVRATLVETGYPPQRLHFVAGPVEETLPGRAPGSLAILRLDTDWYESTRHELVHLYPRLVSGGVLVIDDYGHWEGARRAVDEYFAANPPAPLLARIDYTARIAVKR